MTEKSLKTKAEEIMVAVDHDLGELDQAQSPTALAEVDSRANVIVNTLFNVVSDVDLEAAAARVKQLKEKHPEASRQELAQILIREKSQKTATVGAVTSGAALIPGLGTAAALTLGVAADIGATFKLQAELVLEIATVYEHPLNEDEKQRLVMVITGISAGTTVLTRKAGQAIAVKAGEQLAGRAIGKSLLKAIPIIGVFASAGTNVLSTYVIGQRADAYFRLGPDAVGSWADSLRAVTGVDERKLGSWLADSGKAGGSTLALGAGKVGQAGKVTGGAMVVGAGKVAGTTAVGAQKAGQAAQSGFKAYLAWVVAFWTAVFGLIGGIFRLLWLVISFIPRQIVGLFGRKKNDQ
jgi:hypothetical protein